MLSTTYVCRTSTVRRRGTQNVPVHTPSGDDHCQRGRNQRSDDGHQSQCCCLLYKDDWQNHSKPHASNLGHTEEQCAGQDHHNNQANCYLVKSKISVFAEYLLCSPERNCVSVPWAITPHSFIHLWIWNHPYWMPSLQKCLGLELVWICAFFYI